VAHRLIGIHRSNRRCRWLLTAYSNVLACLNVGVFALTRPGHPLLPTCSWLCLSTCFDRYCGGAAVGCRRLRVRFPARTRLCNDPAGASCSHPCDSVYQAVQTAAGQGAVTPCGREGNRGPGGKHIHRFILRTFPVKIIHEFSASFSWCFGTMKYPWKCHGFSMETKNHGFSVEILLCQSTMCKCAHVT